MLERKANLLLEIEFSLLNIFDIHHKITTAEKVALDGKKVGFIKKNLLKSAGIYRQLLEFIFHKNLYDRFYIPDDKITKPG